MIFGGCCSNVFALEILVNDAPKSGQMITFAQFVCVSAYGLAMHLKWPVVQDLWTPKTTASSSTTSTREAQDQHSDPQGVWRYIPHLKKRKIPITRWLAIVVMFFAVSVLNNQSLAYKISVPLHIIFRSGGLMVGMVLGMIFMKKRYSRSQIFAVTIVTLGVIYATTNAKANAPQKVSSSSKPQQDSASNPGDYAIGVFMLTIALIVSSLMGLLQEATYQTYGAEWREGLFYSHFLALPMFLVFYSDIVEQFRIFNRSTPIPVLQLIRQIGPYLPSSVAYALSSVTIPRLWIFLAVNTLTQFMCISGVHRLTSLSSALTLNFILNLRKFSSLLISVLYFENGFGFEMAVGTSLVLLGTVMYSVSSSSSSSSSNINQPGTIGGIPFTRPYGIDPQDVPWLSELIARQSLRLFDSRQLQDLTPSVCFGPNAAIHTAHLPLQPHSSQTTLVALKQYHRPADLISEVHLLLTTPASQYTNPILGIVQLGDQGLTCLVVPYHPLGNLRQYIADQRQNLKPLSQMQIIHDIASGLEFLHQRGIHHMNLHSANVLISLQGMAVLTDFARPNNRAEVGMPPKPTAEQERVRSLAVVFLAPEVLASNQYSSQSEVYALGMVMFELLTGKVAFERDLNQPGLSNRIMFGRKDEIPANVKGSPGTVYENLIKDCWELLPAKRPHLSQVKFRLEQLMTECRQKNEALKALQLQQQQQYQQQQQAQYMQPYQPGSVAPPTPPLPELPPVIDTIQPQTDSSPNLTLNVITTHIIIADTVRLNTEGLTGTHSTKQQQEETSTVKPKPIEAWTIGQATVSPTAQRRDTIPISSRALEISSAHHRVNVPVPVNVPTTQQDQVITVPMSPDTAHSPPYIALIPVPILPLASPTQYHPATPSASPATGSEISYSSSTGQTWPLPPNMVPPGTLSVAKQTGPANVSIPSVSNPVPPTQTAATAGPISPSSPSFNANDNSDVVTRAYMVGPRTTSISAIATATTPAPIDTMLPATPIAARMIAAAAANQASALPPTPTSASSDPTHQPFNNGVGGSDRHGRESMLIIPVFPEPPSTLHNRCISNIDPRFRQPTRQHNLSGLREHERGHSFSSDDSGSRGPIRAVGGAAMAPQEAVNGAPVTAGLNAREAYTPIASSDDVPTASPSNSIHSAAKNGDLQELQQFLNRALSRSLSNGSSSSSGRGERVSAAEILDEYEPIERLPVLCCAAVARKNKYQALNMVLKAGANVDGKEQRGGNTPLHLICETAPPPLVDPSVARYKQDEFGDRTRSASNVDLLDPNLSQLTLPDLVDEQDEQEQLALDRVKEDSESTFSLLTTDGGFQTLTAQQRSSMAGAYYQMKNHILTKGGLEDQIRLLVLAGSPIDTPNYRGETPLLLLLRFHDSVAALATLLRLGADPTLMAPFGPGTNPAEIHVDPKTILSPAAQKRISKNLRAAGGPKLLFGPKQSAVGQQSPTSPLSSASPLPIGPYNQTMTNDDPNHILVMHGGALAHAAYHLRINCVRYLLDHEIECSDPAIIEQAIVACHHSVAARVNPPLVATQNRILTILSRDWKGEAGRGRRCRVAERTLNKKKKAVRSNVLLVALAVSTAPPPQSSEPSLSSSESQDSSLHGAGEPTSRIRYNHLNYERLSSSLGPIPTTHFYASEGPMGTEIELISQHGFQTDSSSSPTTRVDLAGTTTRYQLSDRVIAPIPIPIKTNGLGYGDQQQQQSVSGREYQDWYRSSDPKSPRSGQGPGGEGKGLYRKFRNMAAKRS
ncbi:golgi uridine diphosphate-N- acetylglucosamine transporter [Mortierella sp. GBA35]|nr:golgi uridine diphosphate-N- acetylglucosamine transporter [Mortierella sp. GBA35]